MATVKEICEGVSRALLDTSVDDVHIADISSIMTDWQELSPYLDLTDVNVHDIVEANPKEPMLQRHKALSKWKECNGDRATYRKLIIILCAHGRVRTAQFVKDLLTGKKSKRVLESDIVISEFSEELYGFYSNDSQNPSFLQWPFSTSHSYAELDLHTAPVVLGPSFDQNQPTKPVTLLLMFSSGRKDARKVILLEGVAGSGKSTLCWYVSKEWSLRRLLHHMKLIIHVSVSDPSLPSAKKLADLIPHQIEDRREAVADAVANMEGEGVCFLFDGCDEAPHLFSRGSFLYHFVAGTGKRSSLSKVTILLTSRPGPAIPIELLKCITDQEKVVIKGFKSLEKFIKATVHEDSLKQKQIFDALEMKPELYSLCHLPLHAVILVYLFDFFKDRLPTTRSELFELLVCNFLIRHMQTRTKHAATIAINNLSTDLPMEIHSSLCKLSKLAYQASLDRNVVLPPALLKDAGIDPACVLSDTFGLLQVQHQLTMRGPCSMYEFAHLSLQEFLAAFHITQLKEHQQYTAFEKVFKRNPLSSILSFYAGLTGLRLDSISDFLLQVVQKPFDLPSTVRALQTSCEPAMDIRRQLLSLMNCVYESQNVTVIDRISFRPKVLEDKVALASDFALYNSTSNVEIELPFMNLYPTDCLSIGYFIRNAGNQISNSFLLNLSSCLLRTKDIKALCHELCKPARYRHLKFCLNIRTIMLTTEAIKMICTMIKRQPALYGLIISGILTVDLRDALKSLIGCIHSTRTIVYLSINDISYTPKPVLHHFILLLHFCTSVTTLNLAGNSAVFQNPKAMLLFCEAVKHSELIRLFLDDCGIDDQKLLMLADAITDRKSIWKSTGGLLQALDIGWNTYTSNGLTEFLEILVEEAKYTMLVVLATSLVEEEHRKLVQIFNSKRKKFYRDFFDLHIDCKNSNWQKEADCMKYLYKQPQLLKRD